jgi:PAP2 family protein
MILKDRNKKNVNFFKSLSFAINGIKYCFKMEKHYKFHIFAFILIMILSFLLKLSSIEFIFIIAVSFLVIITEMLNTCVEVIVDMITKDYNVLAMYAKDLGAGAVLISSILAVIIGLIIFIPKIMRFFV